ncbi:MAG: UvrD-helicase domain-containing protein [Candidatus Andersenbacteria bacterium]
MARLAGLNERQRTAVLHTKGPLLILAGAGSGKTKALTHRIAYLITEKKISPGNILAVTFTNKAAGEMKDRLTQLLAGSYIQSKDGASVRRAELPYVGTFHSLGVRILRRDITKLGYQSHFAIYDEQDQIALVKTALAELKLDPKQFNPHMLLSLIGRAKNELQTPEHVAGKAHEFIEEVVAKVYARYQEKLRDADAVDFDDLLMLTVRLFTEYPKVLEFYRRRFTYIHVDEYQDTNHAQYQLVRLLAGDTHNVAVVGDDWQAIYGWRGADVRNILEFERDYPEATVVLLEQNYRSTQRILDAAGAIIAKNEGQKKKKLWTENQAGELLRVHCAHDEEDEARFVIKDVQQGLEKAGGKKGGENLQPNDIVVLYRTNAQSRPIEEACLSANVSYRIVGGVKFYDRKEVKDVLAYLKFLSNPKDIVAFERLINTPSRGIGPKTRERVVQHAVDTLEGDLRAASLDAVNLKELDATRASAVRELGLRLDKLHKKIHPDKTGERRLYRVVDVIDQVIRQFGFESYLRDGSEEGEDRFQNIKELMTVAGERESLEDFLEQVALVSDIDALNDSHQAITLMSVHAAKGLEFRRVYLVGMEEGIFPHARSLIEPRQLAEERRLCYVAMTRAKESLTLVHADTRTIYGESQLNTRSRFVEDLPAELVEFTGNGAPDSDGRRLDHSVSDGEGWSDDFTENPFNQGERVEHPSFGRGTVTSIDDDLVEISFEKGGTKTLSVNFAPLKKVS